METPVTAKSGRGPLLGQPSRRAFLKFTATAGFAVTGVAAVSSCNSSGSGGGDITLRVASGAPIGPMPSKEERSQSPSSDAYGEALTAWLKDNPGVELKPINVDVWNQEAITTAIAGGTAPAQFVSNVIGGWNSPGIRSAFLQGLAADVTELVEEADVIGRLIAPAQPIWERVWNVEGKYYALPTSYNIGVGVHYRRDLVEERDLPKPEPGWSWVEFREMAKALNDGERKGVAFQSWPLNNALSCEGFDLLSRLPAPETSWNWQWDYSIYADAWIRAIENVRGMRFEDESTMVDISFGDTDILSAFVRGDAAMHINTVVYFSSSPDSDTSTVALADSVGKPVAEVVGWAPMPVGMTGYGASGITQGQIDSASFDPELDDDELAAIFDLQLYMLRDGFIRQKEVIYEHTEDLHRVYDWANIMPIIEGTLEDLPGTPEEAWGEEFMETMRKASEHPLIPSEAWYIPAESATGPTDDALNDTRTKWWYEAKDTDLAADLDQLAKNRNQQANGFTSNVADEDFIEGARKYFEAHGEFWKDNSPSFYEEYYRPWYDKYVQPALGA